MLKEGYTPPFQSRPSLTRSPKLSTAMYILTGNYISLYIYMDKDAVEPVQNLWASSTFLGSKTTQPLETYSRSEQTKPFGDHQDHPPKREWVTSIDFKDAYFHIPIQEQSRKYLRFYVQGQTYQFKALPFRLSTAPLEFTVVAKEVKLMAIHKGIRIHQYLDDWLVRARSHQVCLQHTQDLVKICQELVCW